MGCFLGDGIRRENQPDQVVKGGMFHRSFRVLLMAGWWALTLGMGAAAMRSAEPIKIQLSLEKQSPVPAWGLDAKLTLKPMAENPAAPAVLRRLFKDEGYTVFRLPIYAMRAVDDPIYDHVIAMAKAARRENPDMVLFSSVANGDGDQNNWLHGKHKFPPAMLGGDADIYGLKLDVYAAYLDAWLRRMREAGVSIDWLGAFNEDAASARDYARLRTAMREDDTGKLQIVGLETWGLGNAVRAGAEMGPQVDVIGSHLYDDREGHAVIPREEWSQRWQQLVAGAGGKPVWFSEAPRYREFEHDGIEETLEALERLVPALNAGIAGVILYQTVPGIVNYDNTLAVPKRSAFQALMDSTRDASLVPSSHDGPVNFRTLVYRQYDGSLIWHLVNASDAPVALDLENRRVGGARRWDGESVGTPQEATRQVGVLTVPARTYFVVKTEDLKLSSLHQRFAEAEVRTEANRVTVSTGKIARTWTLTPQGLRTSMLTNLDSGQSWTDQEPHGADWDHPTLLGPDAAAELVSLTAIESDDGGFTERHLEVVAGFHYPDSGVQLEYRIWAYPGAEGLRTQLWVRGTPRVDGGLGLPQLTQSPAVSPASNEVGFKVLALPQGADWTLNLAWAETSNPPTMLLTSVDGEARQTQAGTLTGVRAIMSADLRLDGTVTVRVSGNNFAPAITRAWLSSPDGSRRVEQTGTQSVASLSATGRVENLPVAGLTYRAVGYYNDTQHRHEPELHLVRDEAVDTGEIEWASVLMGETAAGGVAIVKESHKCVNQFGVDTGSFLVDDARVEVTGWGIGRKDLDPIEWKWAWATWTVLYDAPTSNARQLALKRFDRIRYPQSAALDLYLKANTWGSGIDQPASMMRASETEILAELDSVADLGLDTLQIDDGWQIGRMRKESVPMVEWEVRPDWYPEGWVNVVAKAKAVGVDLGIWHAARAPLAALKRNWEQGHFKTWKLDFANLGAYAGVNDYLAKGRDFVTFTDHTVRVNWDVTENAPRYGYFWARECGNIWLANRKPLQPANVVPRPWLMLREAWELAHYLNLQKFELPVQNFRRVNQEVSDAYLHSDTYSTALGLPGIPVFFQTTRLLEQDQREEIKTLLEVYRAERESLFHAFVFPLGDEPTNATWSGFQWHDPLGVADYVLLFRERLNADARKVVPLRFFAPGTTIRIENLRDGTSDSQTLDARSAATFSLSQPGDVLFLRLTTP